MEKVAKGKSGLPSVTATHEIDEAIKAAFDRAGAVFSSEKPTLIDQISDDDWASWDASHEMAVVFDKSDLVNEIYADDDELEPIAA
jgi:hypothetical protein